MTPSQMSLSTFQQLADLAPTTKVELLALANNKLTVVIAGADMIAIGEARNVQEMAESIKREGRSFLQQLNTLLK